MLSPLDDFPLHQTSRPIAVPAATDRNAYGRYWFGAFERTGAFQVEAAFGRYPNLRVTDCSVSISRDGEQHSFHASRQAPADPTDLTVGPFSLEVVEPMRRLRLTVGDNETGITADLSWTARTGALLEDHTEMTSGPTVIIDMARFLQFGTWSGWVTAGGVTTDLDDDRVLGVRDRSWGVRPVGERPGGRPAEHGSACWFWMPIHFDDECRTTGWFQRPGGEFWRADGHRLPVLDPVPLSIDNDHPDVFRLDPVAQDVVFEPDTRRISEARFTMRTPSGEQVLDLESLHHFHMRGLGYTNLDWGHGMWKGELAVGSEHWRFADIDAKDPFHQHLHHVVKANVDGREGVGLLEQIIFGPHTQFGFTEWL